MKVWHRQVVRRIIAISLVVFAIAGSATVVMRQGCQSTPARAKVAQLEVLAGLVTLQHNGQGEAITLEGLRDGFFGDVITTSANGRILVRFADGLVVEFEPHSKFVLTPGKGSNGLLGITMLEGSAHLVGAVKIGLATFTVPFGVLRLGQQPIDLHIDLTKRIKVNLGPIEFQNVQEFQLKAQSGDEITLDGLVLSMVKKPKTLVELDLPPLKFVMFSKGKQTFIKYKGAGNWKPLGKRSPVETKDMIQVRSGGESRIALPDGGNMTVLAGSTLHIDKAQENQEQVQITSTLEVGRVQLQLTKDPNRQDNYTLQTSQGNVLLTSTVRAADAEVGTNSKETQVELRFGQITLQDGQSIEAGQRFRLSNNQLVAPPQPLGTYQVPVHHKSNSVLHLTDKTPPAVAFMWEDASHQPTLFELAEDRNFNRLLAGETSSRGTFVHDRLHLGNYFWRLDSDPSRINSLQLLSERDGDCLDCKASSNVIEETGDRAIIMFQQEPPGITLRWKANPDAVQYRLELYADDGKFSSPLVKDVTTQPSKIIPAGRLREGKYLWLVKSLDEQGKEIATGLMNYLDLRYDNNVLLLRIKAPLQSGTTDKSTYTTVGEVELESKLWINGKRVELDEDGRFSHDLLLTDGSNALVYRLLRKDGVEHYFVRELQKKAAK